MTPAARLSAAIDCMDAILGGAPAEKTLTNWARGARYAGSKDRAAVRDHVFDALRALESCIALGGARTGRAVILGLSRMQGAEVEALFSGEGHGPASLDDVERALLAQPCDIQEHWNLPDDAIAQLRTSHPETALDIAKALQHRASVDLRVNLRKTDLGGAIAALAADGIECTPVKTVATALRVTLGARKVKNSAAFKDGLVELQDAGSQALVIAIAEALDQGKNLKVLDYCAGGGGKSLALAALVEGRFLAHDANPKRMTDLAPRAQRAGVQITTVQGKDVHRHAPFDLIICDAPCSGSGAWRRSPDAKWRFDNSALETVTGIQDDILNTAVQLLAPGGMLAYATCSLFDAENQERTRAFTKRHPSLAVTSAFQWTPIDGTDGFFLALIE